MPTNTRRSFLVPLVILFGGMALRLWLHDYHGLEGDDAFSLALSRIATADLIRGLLRLELDVHPPLHFLTLRVWVALAGESLLSLRALNLLLDALTGALLVGISRRGARTDGLVIAALWAVSPALIFGGWLVRMYTLLGLTAAGALWCVVGAYRGRRLWPWTLGALAFSLAALYTHVLGGVVWAATAFAFYWLGVVDRRRDVGLIVLMSFWAVLILWMPFIVPVSDLYSSGADLGASVNPAYAVSPAAVPLEIVATVVAFRMPLPGWVTLALAGILTVVALVALPREPYPLWAFVLVCLDGLVILGAGADFYKPRYVVPFAGVLLLPVAWGASRLLDRAPVVGALLTMMLLGGGLWGVTAALARDWRDDWTAAGSYLSSYDAPGDVIVVVPDWGQEAARYHYDGAAPVRGFFPQIAPGLDLDAAFSPFVAEAERVWLVRYQPEVSDPDGLALAYFDAGCPPVTRAFPAGMQVSLYDCERQTDTLPDAFNAVDIAFGDVVTLRGVGSLPGRVSASDTRLYDESGRVLVSLAWEPLVDGIGGAAPRVQLTDTSGAVYGGALPDPALPPVEMWRAGETVIAYYDLNLNPGTPAGVYNVSVFVDGPGGGPLLAAGAGAGEVWFIAGQVRVD